MCEPGYKVELFDWNWDDCGKELVESGLLSMEEYLKKFSDWRVKISRYSAGFMSYATGDAGKEIDHYNMSIDTALLVADMIKEVCSKKGEQYKISYQTRDVERELEVWNEILPKLNSEQANE